MARDAKRLKDLFNAAADLPAGERSGFLDRECEGDPELRARLGALLEAHEAPISALERPLAADLGTRSFVPRDPEEESPPTPPEDLSRLIAGRYKRLELIGEGGMGQVWVAEQLEPIRRRVALKLIRPGMDSRNVLARFEAERQALALMDHPNIAKVFDAGTTDDGRPFFVMELVKGVPITEFCDARRLNPRERLELFVPVCKAIQHAHQKGIIHRDIKPSNVMVALHDETPVPKVIDFGVAKAVGQQLTEKTLYTGFGALIGTPTYMAPEQATLNQLDIDTRTDVYALGVLLYELLAGSPPFEPERLKRVALDEVLRLVREEDPPRPSQRLSTSESKASLAAVRRSDPEKLARLVRGELDWIVMKALEKDRNRRYDTANNLGADIQRHLDGEAVQAHPPGAVYRLRKFARKHKAGMIFGTVFLLVLIKAALISGWLAVRAHNAEQRALAEQRVAMARRFEAESNEEQARVNLGKYESTFQQLNKAKQEAERTAASLRIDLTLAEIARNERRSILQLTRDLGKIPENASDLREFATAAILSVGQGHAPLLPRIHHDGVAIVAAFVSSDNRRILTLGKDGLLRVWDARTASKIADLRQGSEKVVACNFSADGKAIVTDDRTSIARIWDAETGAFRVATEPRPNRYRLLDEQPFSRDDDSPARYPRFNRFARITTDRLITLGTVETRKEEKGITRKTFEPAGPAELWDLATGQRIASLDVPGRILDSLEFHGKGQWITAREGTDVVVLSAVDGTPLARLANPSPQGRLSVIEDVPGRRLATIVRSDDEVAILRAWSPENMWAPPEPVAHPRLSYPLWWSGDAIGARGSGGALVSPISREIVRLGPPLRVESLSSWVFVPQPDGFDLIQLDHGQVAELKTGRIKTPPPDRRFAPDLIAFSPDRRYALGSRRDAFAAQAALIDLGLEKLLPAGKGVDVEIGWGDNLYGWGPRYRYLKDFGYLAVVQPDDFTLEVHRIPTEGNHDAWPPELLQAWAEVAMQGELRPQDGEFQAWDEPTWQAKRKALEGFPVLPSLPGLGDDIPLEMPGTVTGDPLHWARADFREKEYRLGERLAPARALLQRAEALGSKVDAAYFRGEVEKEEKARRDREAQK